MNGRKAPPKSRQLVLTLPLDPALGRDDFIEGEANRTALSAIERWPDWPAGLLYLQGPPGSGKTHLAAIFMAASGAGRIEAAGIGGAEPEALLAAGALAIEDLEPGAFDEAGLFHLLNLARGRASLLLTSRHAPGGLDIRTPDLLSRLRAAEPQQLSAPDDALLRKVLVKLFADRQLSVDPGVIGYVLGRIERSLGAVNAFVEAVDRLALETGRPVTRRLAAEALPAEGDLLDDAGLDG